MSDLEKEIVDEYKNHEQHIVAPSGKRVPFYRNAKTCSTCFSEREKILKRSHKLVLCGSGWNYDYNEYKIE